MTDETPKRPRQYKVKQESQDTPSEEIVAASRRQPVMVIDELGRPIKVKYLTLLDHMRVNRVLGSELSKNDQYKALATLAFCVLEFNGDVAPPPSTVREVEAAIDRLGEEGARAIGNVYSSEGWAAPKDDLQDDVDIAKN